MKKEFLIKNFRSRLILFFLGWGLDPRPFFLSSQKYDVIFLYDYRKLPFQLDIDISAYKEIVILSWSAGVRVSLSWWEDLKNAKWILINGTGAFIHKKWGIPPLIFHKTYEALNKDGEKALYAFYKNMFKGEKEENFFFQNPPQRDLKSLLLELKTLVHLEPIIPPISIKALALIGTKDKIFPAFSQERFYKEASLKYEKHPWGHFPFYRFHYFEDIIKIYERYFEKETQMPF